MMDVKILKLESSGFSMLESSGYSFLRTSLSRDSHNKLKFRLLRVLMFEVTYQRTYLWFFTKKYQGYVFFDKKRGWQLSKSIHPKKVRQPLLEALNTYLHESRIKVE